MERELKITNPSRDVIRIAFSNGWNTEVFDSVEAIPELPLHWSLYVPQQTENCYISTSSLN